MKFALVSPTLPPSWSGQAVIIYRLLKGLKPNDYCLISRESYDTVSSQEEYTRRLPAPYYQLPPLFQLPQAFENWYGRSVGPGRRFIGVLARAHRRAFENRLSRRLGLDSDFINVSVNILSTAQRIASIIRRENCKAVVACTAGDVYYLPASYLASRLTRVEFYPYIFDYYSHQWIDAKQRRLAERFEPTLIKGATGIIAPNEFMRDELRRQYGVEATLIRNCCDLSLYESSDAASPSDASNAVEQQAGDERDNINKNEIGIVYTGALSEAHIEAFRNLLSALELLRRPAVTLHLYTAQSPSALAEKGIKGPIVFHGHQTVFAISTIQQQADMLFLPLAFNSPYPDIIKTSAPVKMPDYLAAGRPILVHAPADSFIAWYFREHECGLVVDEDDPTKLADAIEQLLCDADLRRRISERARERAHADFSDEMARARFAQLLKLE